MVRLTTLLLLVPLLLRLLLPVARSGGAGRHTRIHRFCACLVSLRPSHLPCLACVWPSAGEMDVGMTEDVIIATINYRAYQQQ